MEEMILCAASAYTRKYYLNEAFGQLPPQIIDGKRISQEIKDELKVMCVLFTEDIGGTLTLFFDEEGRLQFRTDADEGDLLYDDIGSVLKVKQLQRVRQDLLEALELYYKVLGG